MHASSIHPRGNPELMLEYVDDTLKRLLANQPKDLVRARSLVLQCQIQLEDAIRDPAMQRLCEVAQHGYKLDSALNGLSWYTRLGHSVCVGAGCIALTVKGSELDCNVKASGFGGLVHDLGHFAGSHDVEHVANDRIGFDHEAHGRQIYRESSRLRKAVVDSGANISWFVAAQREIGNPGIHESVADTMTYIHYDPLAYDLEIGSDIGPAIVNALIRVEDGYIVVDDMDPFQELLNRRAAMHRQLYNTLECRVRSHALGALLAAMDRAGDQEIWQFMVTATDTQLVSRAQAFVADKPRVYVDNLYQLALCQADYQEHFWLIGCGSEQECMSKSKQLGLTQTVWFMVPPIDFCDKVFRAERGGVWTHLLKADAGVHLGAHHRQYTLVAHKG